MGSDPRMAPGDFSFRLVRHDLEDGSAHLDLFIDVGPGEELVTYELPMDFLSELRQMEQARLEARTDENDADSDLAPAQGDFRAGLKAPHRRKYWTYAGEISGNRGRIREIARGIIRGGAWRDEIRVRIVQGK